VSDGSSSAGLGLSHDLNGKVLATTALTPRVRLLQVKMPGSVAPGESMYGVVPRGAEAPGAEAPGGMPFGVNFALEPSPRSPAQIVLQATSAG
jgi:hypothetical protein